MISPTDCIKNKLSLNDCVRFMDAELRGWWNDLPWWTGWALLLGGLILVALIGEVQKAVRKSRDRPATPER